VLFRRMPNEGGRDVSRVDLKLESSLVIICPYTNFASYAMAVPTVPRPPFSRVCGESTVPVGAV